MLSPAVVSFDQLLTDIYLACRAISSRRLVPGDVVVVLPGRATCDMALLQGNCLVEESNLSGEVPLPALMPSFQCQPAACAGPFLRALLSYTVADSGVRVH